MNMKKKAAISEWTLASTYTLVCLTLIATLNYLDRGLLGLLLPAIKKDLQISDTVLGLVAGLTFALFYSTIGIPIARLADRHNRRNIISIGLSLWSLMTALTGTVANVWQLAATRFLLGAGEASSMGPSHSIVSDLFTGKNRPIAIGVLAASSSIAALVFVPIAGWISIEYGWRAVFFVCGLPGLAFALLFYITVREPERQKSTTDAGPRLADAMRFLARSRPFVIVTVAECFYTIGFYASSAWTSSFLVRVHGLDMMTISATLGPFKGVVGIAGALLGGWMVSPLAQRDPRWRLWLPAVAMAITLPAEAMFLFGSSLPVALTGFGMATMMASIHQAPVFAVIMNIAEPRMRATALALFVFFSGLVGQIVGPFAVGFLNDVLRPELGEVAIRFSLAICTLPVLAGAAGLWWAANDPALRDDGREA